MTIAVADLRLCLVSRGGAAEVEGREPRLEASSEVRRGVHSETSVVLRVVRVIVLAFVALDMTGIAFDPDAAARGQQGWDAFQYAVGLAALAAIMWLRPRLALGLATALVVVVLARPRLVGVEVFVLMVSVVVGSAVLARRFLAVLLTLASGAIALMWFAFDSVELTTTQAVSVAVALAAGLLARWWLAHQRRSAAQLRETAARTREIRTQIRAELVSDVRRLVGEYLERAERSIAATPARATASAMRATLDEVDSDARLALRALRAALGLLTRPDEQDDPAVEGIETTLSPHRVVAWLDSLPVKLTPVIVAGALALLTVPEVTAGWAVAAVLSTCAAVGAAAWQRPREVLSAVAVSCIAVQPDPTWTVPLALGAAGLYVGIRGSGRLVAIGYAVLAMVVTLWVVRDALSVPVVVAAVVAAVLAHIVGLVLGNQLHFLRASTAAARRLALERAGLRVAERHYLARELHDVVGHDLTRITLRGLSISGVNDEAALRGALADMRSLTSAARGSMDDLMSQLGEVRADESPAPLSRAPSDVLAEVHRVLGDSGHPVSARVDPAIDDLDALARASFTRIATEMSTNVLKHAPVGASCLMDADVSNGEVVLTMANSLGQAKVALGHGFGLISMRERARALGSDVTTERRGGQWRIVARVPLNVTSTLPLD